MWTLTTAMQVNVINRAMDTARKEEELELVDGEGGGRPPGRNKAGAEA